MQYLVRLYLYRSLGAVLDHDCVQSSILKRQGSHRNQDTEAGTQTGRNRQTSKTYNRDGMARSDW